MTLLDEPALLDDADLDADALDTAPDAPTGAPVDDEERAVQWADLRRSLLATGLATCGSGLVVGGIFGSWTARLVCVLAAIAGTAWVFVARRAQQPMIAQLMVLPMLLVLGLLTLIGTSGGGPGELPSLIDDAVNSGRLFRPPVPFDAGWRPLLVFLIGMLGFAAGSIGVTQQRPKTGVGVTVPLTVLALISQPDDSAFIGGVFAFLPLIGALAILFGEDGGRSNHLSRDFEVKRAVRGVVGALGVVVVLLGLNSASFLFPEPVYDPDDQPQKPRAVPLSASRDRVLFEVVTDSTITGPWRVGALDVYQDDTFQSVPSERRLASIPASGALSPLRAGRTQQTVTLTVRDLGDTASAPVLAGTTSVDFAAPSNLRYDPRYEVMRVPSGRVAANTSYTLSLPPYPTNDELAEAAPGAEDDFDDELAVDADPPTAVADLLRDAPPSPWRKLDLLRQTLLDRVVASGAGVPTAVSAKRVGEIMAPPDADADADASGGNEATPYEIVAAEAIMARWVGIPSRIGFGFDGLNVEGELLTVRPRNSAQWLEVYFEGFGWVPLIAQPDQAKASLDNDPNARNTPEVEASDDVAVKVYVVYERRDVRLLFQRVRDAILRYGPFALATVAAYVVYPWAAKQVRARRRRRWAASIGPLAQIATEYAELRDLCIDLNIGDDYDTPLEYLSKVAYDREHEELAWLMTRAVYGDLVDRLGPNDVRAAQDLSRSVRARLAKAQPAQSRLLGYISRASIEVPYSTEFPNIRVIRVFPIVQRVFGVVFGPVRRVLTAAAATVRRATRAVIDVPRRAINRRLSDTEGIS